VTLYGESMLNPDEEKVLEIGLEAALKPVHDWLDDMLGPSSSLRDANYTLYFNCDRKVRFG